ncbi:hypothetical protein HDU86_003934 [Geranomyces michiganensis]|nr:hypothetical protein HDU86_003934 [Geranomyces michiganensis]
MDGNSFWIIPTNKTSKLTFERLTTPASSLAKRSAFGNFETPVKRTKSATVQNHETTIDDTTSEAGDLAHSSLINTPTHSANVSLEAPSTPPARTKRVKSTSNPSTPPLTRRKAGDDGHNNVVSIAAVYPSPPSQKKVHATPGLPLSDIPLPDLSSTHLTDRDFSSSSEDDNPRVQRQIKPYQRPNVSPADLALNGMGTSHDQFMAFFEYPFGKGTPVTKDTRRQSKRTTKNKTPAKFS